MWERSSLPIGHIRRERPSTPSAHMARPVRLSPRTGLFFSGIRFFEASHSFSFRLKDGAGIRRRRSSGTPQARHACAKLDSKTQQISARLRFLMTDAVSLLDKSKLFHKIFMSRLN